MLKRFLSYYKPHAFMLTLDMLASLLIALIGMVYPIVTNLMLNDYIPNKMYGTIVLAGAIVLVGGAGGVYAYALNQNKRRKAAAARAAANRRKAAAAAADHRRSTDRPT